MKIFFNPYHNGDYKIFGTPHFIFMIFTAISVLMIGYMFKHAEKEKIRRFIKISALLSIAFDPIYWIWEYINFGEFDFSKTLPLYFCSLFWILMPIVAFSDKHTIQNRIATSYICSMGIVTGSFGIIFSTYLMEHPMFSFICVRSLSYHFLMLLVPSVLWFSGYYKPEIKDVFLYTIPPLILFFPCFILDKNFGWDYCYLNGGVGTPLANVSSRVPNSLFILFGYITLFALVDIIFYLPVIKQYLKEKKSEELETVDVN